MKKTRRTMHVVFALSMVIIGCLIPFLLQSKILLVPFIKLPLMSRWLFLIMPISLAIAIVTKWLMSIGLYGMIIEDNNQEALRDLDTQELIKCTSFDILISLFGIVMLKNPEAFLSDWRLAEPVYRYSILWLNAIPFISGLLEFATPQGIIKGWDDIKTAAILYTNRANGFVTMVAALINIALLILISNMSVCVYTYSILCGLFLFRAIINRHLYNTLWPKNPPREISEIDQKEGIA